MRQALVDVDVLGLVDEAKEAHLNIAQVEGNPFKWP